MKSRLALVLSVLLINGLSIIGANPDIVLNHVGVVHINQSNEGQKECLNTMIATITNWKSEIETRVNQISDQNEQFKNQLKNITDQSKLLQSADEKVNFMITNIGNLQSRLKTAKNETQNKEDQISDITKQLNSQIETITDKTNQLNMQMKNITDLSDKVNSMNKTINDLNNNLETARNRIKTRNDKIAKLTKQIEDLQNEIKNKDEHIKKQGEDIATKDSQINDLSNQIKSNSIKISEITDDLLKCYPISRCPIEGPSAIYNITVGGIKTFEAPCNSTGWLTIQKRFDGSENFDRTWQDYKDGFGNIKGEFFIGLERLHIMTEERPHELYIKLGMVNGSTAYAYYDDFKIGSEGELYELKSLGIYNGTAGDSLKYHKNMKFTTRDRDNDDKSNGNCAANKWGGWWYKVCAWSRLNGKFYKEGKSGDKGDNGGILWGSWHNYDWKYSLTFAEMMIRPKTLKTEA